MENVMPPASSSGRSRWFGKLFAGRQWLRLWFPFLLGLAALVVVASPLGVRHFGVSLPGVLLYGAGVIYLLVVSILWLLRKEISLGIVALLCFLVSLAAIVPAAAWAFVHSVDWDAGDDFTEGLTLPAGVPLAEPLPSGFFEKDGEGEDSFQSAIRAAAGPGGTDASIDTSIPSLEAAGRDHRDLLEQYLAAHPAWFVFEDRGLRYAMRRWKRGGRWTKSLNGYYSEFSSSERFQSRTAICLSGTPTFRRTEKLPANRTVTPKLSDAHKTLQSRIYIGLLDDLGLDQFEQSVSPERGVTKAAIAEIEREFAAFLENPDWASVRDRLPEGAVTRGKASIELQKGMQGGIYETRVRCNPGESGTIYLKAFEITKNTPLSARRLAERSEERMGWSDDPEELFSANANISIYEGNWEEYYGARFEVWFRPDAGGAERKLTEGNFKIEGWMR